MGKCFFCGREIGGSEKIYRSSLCPDCGKDLRICYNCKFYAPGYQWDCRETISELVRDKDSANFCDFFSFAGQGGKNTNQDKEKARSVFEKLFNEEQ